MELINRAQLALHYKKTGYGMSALIYRIGLSFPKPQKISNTEFYPKAEAIQAIDFHMNAKAVKKKKEPKPKNENYFSGQKFLRM